MDSNALRGGVRCRSTLTRRRPARSANGPPRRNGPYLGRRRRDTFSPGRACCRPALGAGVVLIWVEPCAGSFAVGFSLLGLRAPCGWQGGKTRYAVSIVGGLGLVGVRPEAIALSDLLWADCLMELCRPGGASRVRKVLARWLSETPDTPRGHRALWFRLRDLPQTPGPIGAARWLALVAGSAFSGGGSIRRDVETWEDSAARNRTISKRMLAALEAFPPEGLPLALARHRAEDLTPEALEAAVPGALSGVHGPVWAYIDPPYQNTAPYAGVPREAALSRAGVLALVERWRSAGASVAVSEGCAIPGATRAFEVLPKGLGQTARGSTKQEWVSVFEQAP